MDQRTRLTTIQRLQIYNKHVNNKANGYDFTREYHVSRPTIHKSTIVRFQCLKYGMRRLARIEKYIEKKLKKRVKYYNKDYPGQMVLG